MNSMNASNGGATSDAYNSESKMHRNNHGF